MVDGINVVNMQKETREALQEGKEDYRR